MNAGDSTINEVGVGVRFDVLGLITQVGFDMLGSGPLRMPGMVMRMRWVVLGLSSRGAGLSSGGVALEIVGGFARQWQEQRKEGGHTS